MLLDSYTLKGGLTSLLPAPPPAGFVKRVNSSFTKIDILLKTIQIRPSPPEALVQGYLIHIADRNEANFRRVLELKGIRTKQDQAHLVELFNLHRASDRHAPNLQQSNPLFALLQLSQSTSSATAGSTVSQGLSNLGTTAAASIGGSTLPGRFDATLLGSAIISAAKDGVDRLPLGSSNVGGVGGASTAGSGTASPAQPLSVQRAAGDNGLEGSGGASAATNLNENLKNLGKFFRRDLGGFGSRFGRSGDDSNR
jgi:hypothetical protein